VGKFFGEVLFMKIVVCIKQVPDTADIKWTENNTMVREGVESIINPFDEYAIETALRIKDENPDTHITVLTMGPPQAQEILKRAIAMGCDEGILVTDRKFAGADTQATSRTLAQSIRKKVSDFDLIICGQFAIDGDTAQTGPSIAQHLDLPQVTYAKEALPIHQNKVLVTRETEYGIEKLKMQLPGVICTIKCDYKPRKFTISGSIKAQDTPINVYSMEDVGLEPDMVGIKGSPTYVSKAFRPERKENCQMIEGTTDEIVATLVGHLKELGVKNA
jgi:electron transfer flavoprotein beta subunit